MDFNNCGRFFAKTQDSPKLFSANEVHALKKPDRFTTRYPSLTADKIALVRGNLLSAAHSLGHAINEPEFYQFYTYNHEPNVVQETLDKACTVVKLILDKDDELHQLHPYGFDPHKTLEQTIRNPHLDPTNPDKTERVKVTIDTTCAPTNLDSDNAALRAIYKRVCPRINAALKIMSSAFPEKKYATAAPDLVATIFSVHKLLLPPARQSQINPGRLKSQLTNFEYFIDSIVDMQTNIKTARLDTHKNTPMFHRLIALEQQLIEILDHAGKPFYEIAKELHYHLQYQGRINLNPRSPEERAEVQSKRTKHDEDSRQEMESIIAEFRRNQISSSHESNLHIGKNGQTVVKDIHLDNSVTEHAMDESRFTTSRNLAFINAYSSLQTAIQELIHIDTSRLPTSMVIRPDGLDLHDELHMMLFEMNDLMVEARLPYEEVPGRSKLPQNAGPSRPAS